LFKQRLITALILAPIAIAGIFFLNPFYFSLFIGFIISLGAWEWANLAGFEDSKLRVCYAGFIAFCLFISHFISAHIILGISVLWWVLAAVFIYLYPRNTQYWSAPITGLLLGILVLVPAWRGLVYLRSGTITISSDINTLLVILFIMLLVWGADVGAYFSGRAWGKRKLAPSVSPGKSWEGVWGGLCVCLLLAIAASSLYKFSLEHSISLILMSVVTAVVSVEGDLLESMFKRHRGIKDSSQLLPGHGGILDRIDSLTAAIPVFTFLLIQAGWLVNG
jgi:phosphatidate cytidylyltransferase